MGSAVRESCFEWRASYSSFGRRVLIRTNDPDLFRLLPDLLPPLAVPSKALSFDRTLSLRRPGPCPCGTRHERAELFGGRTLLFSGPDFGAARLRLRTFLKLDVAEFARRRVFLHAGAVAWNGLGIVIPGSTMSGKTSLVRELLRAGATYYSDEYAVIDGLGRLHPYPQPLAVRLGGAMAQHDHPAESLGATTATGSVPVGFVVVTRHTRGRRWDPAVLSAGHTVLAMLEHAVAARRDPERVMSALKHVAEHAVGWRGDRGGARSTARAILARIG